MENQNDIARIQKTQGVKELYEFDDAVFVYFDSLNDAKFFVTGICSEGKFKLEQINVMVRLSKKKKEGTKNEQSISGNSEKRNGAPEKDRKPRVCCVHRRWSTKGSYLRSRDK
jgi:hypothetical protein